MEDEDQEAGGEMVRVRIQDTQLPQPAHALRVFPTDIKTVPVCLSLSLSKKKKDCSRLDRNRSRLIDDRGKSLSPRHSEELRSIPIAGGDRGRYRSAVEREEEERETSRERERER